MIKPASIRPLRPKERLYILGAARGYSAKQTAARHYVTVNTVNSTIVNARAALGARNIAHAVAIALSTGQITFTELREEG